jgi:hypothetical protein
MCPPALTLATLHRLPARESVSVAGRCEVEERVGLEEKEPGAWLP